MERCAVVKLNEPASMVTPRRRSYSDWSSNQAYLNDYLLYCLPSRSLRLTSLALTLPSSSNKCPRVVLLPASTWPAMTIVQSGCSQSGWSWAALLFCLLPDDSAADVLRCVQVLLWSSIFSCFVTAGEEVQCTLSFADYWGVCVFFFSNFCEVKLVSGAVPFFLFSEFAFAAAEFDVCDRGILLLLLSLSLTAKVCDLDVLMDSPLWVDRFVLRQDISALMQQSMS